MKPIKFDGSNRVLAHDESDDLFGGPLPYGTNGLECVTLWKPSLRERLSILLFGKVWVCVLAATLDPLAVYGERDFLNRPDEF